ncbi:saccharopine dehydrogenase-like oxidoreductase [Oppia nitens]|uniref:saccharopine dehydrogenase-like oxidoreductase n=1 Tax=Oppia nitens TaxID=1686743 RepID=UPI0023DB8BD0|nr:saccharopine dehydrogenase-like oxidoreductase [Oppia nitens]
MRLTNLLMNAKKTIDVVVLGATGFTGKFVVNKLAETLINDTKFNQPIVWAIAGRNRAKLQTVLDQTSKDVGVDLSVSSSSSTSIPIIEVDINNKQSLLDMCRKCRLVINCCGPYRLLGEQVVNACITAGNCHHIDVSGEPQFLETIQLNYDKPAKLANCSIVGSCGFDSVPSDIGVQYVKSVFNGTVNSIETYLRVTSSINTRVTYNMATWHSLVYGYAYRHELKQLRQQLYNSLKKYQWKYRINRKSIAKLSDGSSGYSVPFPGSDRSVIMRTQLANYTTSNERPVQIETYFTVKSLGAVFALIFVNLSVSLLSRYTSGRQLLMKYPHIFSLGTFNRDTEPDRQKLLSRNWCITFVAQGWPQIYTDPCFQPTEEIPNKQLVAQISGGDLAYMDTSTIVTQIAIHMIELMNKNQLKSGVMTPGMAFESKILLDKLDANGIKFRLKL